MMQSLRISSRIQATELNVTFASRNEIIEISRNRDHPQAGVVEYHELGESERVNIEVQSPEEMIAVKEDASRKHVHFAETGDLVEFKVDDPPTALFRRKNTEERGQSFAEKEVLNVSGFPVAVIMGIYEVARGGVNQGG